MKTKPISPLMHGLIDYALAGSLLCLPTLLGFNKKVRNLYKAEAMLLLGYVAISDHPAAIKPVIPFSTHGKIDPFNVAGFAAQTFYKPFRKNKAEMAFNIAFTTVAALTVLLTDWNGNKEDVDSPDIKVYKNCFYKR